MGLKYELTGQKFGMYSVMERAEKYRTDTKWKCKCDCGNIRFVLGHSLRSGHSTSCGCRRKIKKEYVKSESPEYNSWRGMVGRCTNPKYTGFVHYGGRGIEVCERWTHSFDNFSEDMGKRPSINHSIDRIDVNGNYEPSNCKWATNQEQARNRRNFNASASGVAGVTFSRGVKKWIAHITVNYKTFHLGLFDKIEDAIQARRDAETEHFK